MRTDWATFRYSNSRTGSNPYENVLNPGNVAGLAPDWSFTAQFYVASSAAGGVVYVGSDDGSVYALNAATGAKLWSYATGDTIESSPAAANGVVYIGSLDHSVYALNAATGAKLWSYATGSYVFPSPAIADGVVYIGSTDSHVYAFDLQ